MTRLGIFLFTGSLREGGCNQLLVMELSLLLGLLQFYLIRGGFTFKAKDEFLIHWWDVLQEVWLLTGLNGGHMTAYLVPGKRKDLRNYLSIEIQIQRPRNHILGQKNSTGHNWHAYFHFWLAENKHEYLRALSDHKYLFDNIVMTHHYITDEGIETRTCPDQSKDNYKDHFKKALLNCNLWGSEWRRDKTWPTKIQNYLQP